MGDKINNSKADKSDGEAQTVLPHRKSFGVEFFVGLFALAGLLAFGYLSINIGGMSFFKSGVYHIKAVFGDVSGLENGAPVEIAGVPVGEVVGIFLNNSSAYVDLEIHDGVEIHDDDLFMIRTKGIIGDRFVKVKPGASDEIIKAGGTVTETVDAVEIEGIIEKLVHSFSSKDESAETDG